MHLEFDQVLVPTSAAPSAGRTHTPTYAPRSYGDGCTCFLVTLITPAVCLSRVTFVSLSLPLPEVPPSLCYQSFSSSESVCLPPAAAPP